MKYGRRAAREVALLILCAADAGRPVTLEDVEGALDGFDRCFRSDPEVLTLLFGGDPEHPDHRTIDRAGRLLGPESDQWPFVERLVRGAVAHRVAIDELIARCSEHWKVRRMGRVDRNTLRVAAYEIAFEPDVPTRVTLNEAIELAKRFGAEGSGAFVNGILDRIARELEQDEAKAPGS